MREMPIQQLPADEFWEYKPDSDTWVVSKKSFHKKLSKNHPQEAICGVCGEWKPTKYSPAELREIDWACSDCLSKHPAEVQELEQREEMEEPAPAIPPKPPVTEERGSKEISTSDPEYKWLLQLVNLVTKAGVPASEIKVLAESHPFKTIDDVGDLAAQIWTLATEKYNIPREWLIKKLPEKKSNLKQASISWDELFKPWKNGNYDSFEYVWNVYKEDYPNVEDWTALSAKTWNKLLYDYGEDLFYQTSRDLQELGSQFPIYRVITVKDPQGFLKALESNKFEGFSGVGVYWSYEPTAAEAHWGKFESGYQKIRLSALVHSSEVDWKNTILANMHLATGMDEREITLLDGAALQVNSVNINGKEIQTSFPVTASLNKKAYEGGYPTEQDSVSFGVAAPGWMANEPWKGSTPETNSEPAIVLCPKCKSGELEKVGEQVKCKACGNVIPKPDRVSDDPTVNDYSQNYYWGPNDLGRSHQNQPGANGWLPAGTEDMDGPSSNVRMSSLEKKADVPQEYWISPDGELHGVGEEGHSAWIAYNADIVSNYTNTENIQELYDTEKSIPADTVDRVYKNMLLDGWTRVGQSQLGSDPTFYIEVADLRSIPKYLDNFMPEWFDDDSIITMSDIAHKRVQITDPFPSLQKAVNKALRQPVMSSFKSFMHKQSNVNKVSHCGPCSVLKMEVLHILIDLYYKDSNLFPEEVIEELSVAATELKLDNFNDILESVITEYLEKKAEEVGDKLPKLKNLLIALKDIALKLGKEIEIVDKQENVEKEASHDDIQVGNILWSDNTNYPILVPANKLDEYFNLIKQIENTSDPDSLEELDSMRSDLHYDLIIYAIEQMGQEKTTELEYEVMEIINKFVDDVTKKASLNINAKEVPTLSNKIVTDLIPMFVDKTEPPDHKCGTCKFRIEKDGKNTCAVMKGEINLKKGTCNYWAEGEASKEQNPSQMERTTAGYVEANLVNCSTCKHYKDDFCSLWNGKVKDEQCCMAWEGATIKEGSLNKQANPPSRFWIAPDGKEFDAGTHHGIWVNNNPEVLKQYGINPPKDKYDMGRAWDDMIKNGWVRISNEPKGSGFSINVNNTKSIPPFVDNFVAKYFKHGDVINVGESNNDSSWVEISDPFPSLQQAVNKALQRKRIGKQASILDEVLDQTTQDAIAAEYGPQMLIAIRFYNDAVRYGQSPDRAVAYALEEVRRMHRPIEQRKFLEVLNTYF